MGALQVEHTLVWRMKLGECGYTSWELVDETGRRWGWLVNAAAFGWTCHVGSWDGTSGTDRGLPVTEQLESFDSAAEGRDWVETKIASAWKARADAATP